MTNSRGDKSRNDQFLEALVEELRTMSDTDALEGENAEELVKLGEHLLKKAREEAGKLRLVEARRKLSIVRKSRPANTTVPVAEAKRYLQAQPDLTLAARSLNELSDTDVLDLFLLAKSLEEATGDAESGEG